MSGRARNSPYRAWASASELAEYAYCPRAWWYQRHPPVEGPTRESRRAAEAGVRFHRSELAAERRRDRLGPGYAILLAVAILLTVAGVVGLLR